MDKDEYMSPMRRLLDAVQKALPKPPSSFESSDDVSSLDLYKAMYDILIFDLIVSALVVAIFVMILLNIIMKVLL